LALAALPAAKIYAAQNSKLKGVQIGTITYSFGQMPVDQIIPAMVSIGLSEVELMSNHCEAMLGAPAAPFGRGQQTQQQQAAMAQQQQALRAWRLATTPDTFKPVRQKFTDAGIDLQILCFNQRVDAKDDEIEYAFQMAKALGVRAISSSSTVAFARRVAPFAEKHKMMWGGHGHADIFDPEEFAKPETFREIMSFGKYIGINLDIGHFTAAGYDPIPFIKENHARITNLHLKDRKKPAQPIKDTNTPNLPWGQGDTPINGVLQLLAQEKYTFPANIELEYMIPPGSDRVAELRKCFEYCKAALA
jgi:sugar phosphate isomerase/epimerase